MLLISSGFISYHFTDLQESVNNSARNAVSAGGIEDNFDIQRVLGTYVAVAVAVVFPNAISAVILPV